MERSVRNLLPAVLMALSTPVFAQSEGGLLLGVEAEKKIDITVSGGTFSVTVNKSWACDNGYESADEADQAAHCVTVVGSPTTQTLAKKKVYVSYE